MVKRFFAGGLLYNFAGIVIFEWLHFTGVPAMPSGIISCLVALVISFFINKSYVFKVNKTKGKSIILFCFHNLIIISTYATLLNISERDYPNYVWLIAPIIILVISVLNFLVFKFFVFKEGEERKKSF